MKYAEWVGRYGSSYQQIYWKSRISEYKTFRHLFDYFDINFYNFYSGNDYIDIL